MTINTKIYQVVREGKIDLNHLFLLYLIQKKEEIPKDLESYKLILQKKGYINEYSELTDKAELLLTSILESDIIDEKKEECKEEPKKLDFHQYCQHIHSELKKRHKELTGKENKNLYGNKYLIPAVGVIIKRLAEASILYKFKVDEKVLKVLLQHIEKCVNTKYEKVRTIEYFLLGQNSKSSDLATALDNYEEQEIITYDYTTEG